MEEVYPLEDELNLLNPHELRFTRDEFQDLVLFRGDERHAGVRLARSFPRSAIWRMVAVNDSQGDELGIITDVRSLEAASRQLVEDELKRRYFVPCIVRVLDIVEHFHVPAWEVETDRGPRRFEIRSGRGDIQVLGARILIRDADGNHYEIRDYRRMDSQSQALVESQL